MFRVFLSIYNFFHETVADFVKTHVQGEEFAFFISFLLFCITPFQDFYYFLLIY